MTDAYPPTAFYFRVALATDDAGDVSFQEVSGIATEVETEAVVEGGENRFVHTLPRGVKHPNLVLKRGIASQSSPLVTWCRSVFDGGFASPVQTMDVLVMLMDQGGQPIRTWSFAKAFPVKWEVDGFNSTKNEVAIETIELSYTSSSRLT